MGDAGPPTPEALLQQEGIVPNTELALDEAPPLREVKVLVTGFGVGAISLRFTLVVLVRWGREWEYGVVPRLVLEAAKWLDLKERIYGQHEETVEDDQVRSTLHLLCNGGCATG